jgi:predicted Mrr-cat superfamily restriction endonuclease
MCPGLWARWLMESMRLLLRWATLPSRRVRAHVRSSLSLIDGADLVELVLQHYEQFDSRHKGLLPLKRVYVPEAIEGAGE